MPSPLERSTRAKLDGAVPPPRFAKSTLREYFETIVVSVIIVLFTKTFVFQHFKIPTGSMEPTLLVGDHLMVNRYIYRSEGGPLLDRVLPTRDVRRGDVIVFKFPDEPQKDFIKRVIGLPGETLLLRDDDVYIDGELQREPYRWLDPSMAIRNRFSGGRMANGGPWVVPQGSYFAMGDNRYNSQDSRFWGHTFIRRDQIKGRALFIWWSYDGPQNIDPAVPYATRTKDFLHMLLHLPMRTRWDRSLRLVR